MKNNKELFRKCPVCQCGIGNIIYAVNLNIPKEYTLPGYYDVVCCDKCGFVFADTTASQEDYQYYYTNCNLYSDVGRVKKELYEETHENDVAMIQKYCKKEDQILDIGCGNGGILQLLSKNGYSNLYGIDPSPQTVEYLSSIGLKSEVLDIFSEIPKRLQQKFDFIICTAVLEHLLFLDLAIKQIKGYLKPKGKLYITVPGIEGFAKYQNLVADYFNQEHINYFNEYGLDLLLKKQGFDKISIKQENNYIIHSKPPEFVLSAVFENTGRAEIKKRNYLAELEISNYLKHNKEREDSIVNRVESILTSDKKIAIWGTGASAMWLIEHIPALMERVEYYVDNNTLKEGKELFGKGIFLPDRLKLNPNIFIIICVMINAEQIQEQMNQMNIINEYYILGE